MLIVKVAEYNYLQFSLSLMVSFLSSSKGEPRARGFAAINIETRALTPSARRTFPLWSAMRLVETDRSWGS